MNAAHPRRHGLACNLCKGVYLSLSFKFHSSLVFSCELNRAELDGNLTDVHAVYMFAGALERLSGQAKYSDAIIKLGGVNALVGLLNAGAHEAFLPTMRSLRQLSGLYCGLHNTQCNNHLSSPDLSH